MVDREFRAALYNAAFTCNPDKRYPPITHFNGWVVGTWCIGSCYKNPNPLYGAYPRGYLDRVHSMFPEVKSVLHAFSGGLQWGSAAKAAWPEIEQGKILHPETHREIHGLEVELVDIHGPEKGRHPTWQGNLLELPEEWADRFDLIIADPPYSTADAKKYECPPPNRPKVMQALHRVCKPGGNLVWLDQQWPMHRSQQWQCWAQIGLVRSTNHRVRLVSMFEALPCSASS